MTHVIYLSVIAFLCVAIVVWYKRAMNMRAKVLVLADACDTAIAQKRTVEQYYAGCVVIPADRVAGKVDRGDIVVSERTGPNSVSHYSPSLASMIRTAGTAGTGPIYSHGSAGAGSYRSGSSGT